MTAFEIKNKLTLLRQQRNAMHLAGDTTSDQYWRVSEEIMDLMKLYLLKLSEGENAGPGYTDGQRF